MSTVRKCKHCGKPIAQVRYGAGLRWEHMTTISGVQVSAGVFCRTTTAAPRGKRAE